MSTPVSAPASGPPAGVTFDAPLQAATTVNVPAPAPAASAPASGAVPAGVTFDAPLQAATTVSISGTPSAQPAPQAAPQATISATPGSMPGDSTASKVSLWAQQLSNDLLSGTDNTGIGKLLKHIGSQPLSEGVSNGTAQFMGSLPLGVLKSIKGGAETAQSGQRWQGTKDIAGGLLDAATIPASFAAPEAGEAAAEGMTKAGTEIAEQAGNAAKAVSKAAKAVKAPLSLDSIQPALQQGIRNAVNSAAEELGVNPSNSASIRDTANDVAQAAKAKAHGLYQQLDNAVGGTRFQAYQEQLNDAMNELRNSISEADPDGHGELIEKVNNLEAAKEKAYQAVKDANLDPDALYAKAQGLWKRASALEDLGNHVEKSTTGMRPELAADATKTNPETVSTSKIFNRANQMYNDGRLQVGLGEKKATQLLQSIDSAHLQALKIAARQKYAKLAGRLALYGGGYEALRHGASHLLGE